MENGGLVQEAPKGSQDVIVVPLRENPAKS